jgi:hypothetical protein
MSDLAKALKKGNYFDQLNDKGYVRVSSKVKQPLMMDNAPVLVKGIPEQFLEPNKLVISAKSDAAKALEKGAFEAESQGLKKAFNAGNDVIGKFGAKSLGSALKGGGKIAAIGAAIGAAGSAMAGENPDWKTMGEGAVSALTPLPVDAAMGSLANSERLGPEDYRRLREDRATPGALEFGNTFNNAMKSGKLQYDGSPRLRAAMMSTKKR